jgi:hypothetical protein
MKFLKTRRSRKIMTVLAGIFLVMQIHSYYRFRFMISDYIHEDMTGYGDKKMRIAEKIRIVILRPIFYSWQVNYAYFLQLFDSSHFDKSYEILNNDFLGYNMSNINTFRKNKTNIDKYRSVNYGKFQSIRKIDWDPFVDSYRESGIYSPNEFHTGNGFPAYGGFYFKFKNYTCTISRSLFSKPICFLFIKKNNLSYVKYVGYNEIYPIKIYRANFDK